MLKFGTGRTIVPLLVRLSIAWIIGIVLARWLNLPWPVLIIASLLALGGLFLYRDIPHLRTWALLGLMLIIGAIRFTFSQPTFDENYVAFYNDASNPVTVTGIVVDEPDIRDHYINLRLQTESLQSETITQSVEGLVLVRAPRYPERFYGDRLAVTGQLETPPIFSDFNYKDYLAHFGIHAMIRRPRVELIEDNQGNPFWAAMLTFKARASQSINRILAEPQASLLNGILLGIETGIPRDLYEDFNL